MLPLRELLAFLEALAPPRLAESWDNVGLLVGQRERVIQRVMTCLTITPDTTAEAVAEGADLVVVHHPLPFQPLRRLTDETVPGRLLLELAAARVALYSPHTALDSAERGINQRLAEGLGLLDIRPLRPHPEGQGGGRCGRVEHPLKLLELGQRLKQFLGITRLQMVGDPQWPVSQVAVACGAVGEMIEDAHARGCHCLVIGEARYHECLAAEAQGLGLLIPGHFASERIAVAWLADVLGTQFPTLTVWASRIERDPIQWC
jgi:dinuclear metal center YbgI/SA1388 family protein